MMILFSIQFPFSFIWNTIQFNFNQIVLLISFSLLQFWFPFLLLTSHLLFRILECLELLLICIMIEMWVVDHWIIHHLRILELIEITWILCVIYLSISVEVLNNFRELLLLEIVSGISTWLMLLNCVGTIFLAFLFVISFI